MKKKKHILAFLIAFIIVVGGSIAYYYYYEDSHYVATEDARVSAQTVAVTPQISGKITEWNVQEGEFVEAGSTLGWQDTGAMANSGGVNVNALNQMASFTAGKAEITAPISGKIIKSSVQEGQMVASGQTLAVIADAKDLYISANIEETKINKVKPGQLVDIKIDALDGKKFQGKVEEVGQATLSTFSVLPAQSSSGSFTKVTQLIPVKIRFPESDKLPLVVGMSAEIKIHIK